MALQYSFIENSESNTERTKSKKHCRTLRKKHKKKTPSKIDNLLNSLSLTQQNMKEGFREGHNETISHRANRCNGITDDDDCSDDEELANFQPLAPVENNVPKDSYQEQGKETIYSSDNETDPSIETFTQLGDVTAEDYYKQYVPYYTQMQGAEENVHTNKDALMTKLNYMIHLLEEQQDEKTDNVTEELVLYLFLGVFVIFVVDSFARAGKYTR
ncbi:MAG: hypothetical protein ACXADW_10215 [Candidatus Hodarchaeales archaeon]|jgi:hypothetical protein